MLDQSLGEIALLAAWIAGAGILVGILAGLFGIGGGAIIVPVLYEVFRALDVPEDVRMQMCIGTSLAIIIPTTVRSYVAHKKKGAVIPEVVRLWSLPAVVGVAIGAVIAYFAPPALFKIVFVVFALFVAVRMLFGTDRWNLGSELPGAGIQGFFGFITGLILVAGRRERRLGVERLVDALRPAVAAGGGDLGRGRRADHHCRHDRLHAGRLAAYGAAAAAVDRLRLGDRLCADGAGVELHRELRRAAGALVAAARARNRLRLFSGAGRRPVS